MFGRQTLLIAGVLTVATCNIASAQNNGLEAPPPQVLTDAEFSRYVNEKSSQPEKTPDELTQEAQVENITAAGQEVEVYSVRNRREVLRVKPDGGPAYFIIDDQGDGSFDESLDAADKKTNQRMWQVFKW